LGGHRLREGDDPRRALLQPETQTFGDPKTAKAFRTVPMVDDLKQILATLALDSGEEGLVFGNGDEPLSVNSLYGRAATDVRHGDLGFEPFALHEARHGYASAMIMGHASITETFDRYGHLMPGAEDEARNRQESYLAKVREGLVDD
jgi:integrase